LHDVVHDVHDRETTFEFVARAETGSTWWA
jgi:hypothetical protein